ncbi:AfsR/SARP family transcriptional regulator [Phytoactinopolyspora mesophila]|uniref:Tetratricopeptide repeat protein n=1 Tax=Phytoactinopolyspora mesophila TaxID=2650750 RepID=A0A7K3M0S7_9ACTN|nr:BTAD domain-containing putative transcriptional regulator [Phytoactinopolyspora mesophila]NDL56901.1 tetratricopeptide repeat protein [Phytoactinopolyspora mesophila]
MAVEFNILGPVEIIAPDVTLSLPRRRERCLLAVLLWEVNRIVPAGRLAELLWDGHPPAAARPTLSSHVSRLRAALAGLAADGEGVELESANGGYRMIADPQSIDAHRFRALVDRAVAEDHPYDRINQLRTALELWRGPVADNAASEWLRDRLFADLEEQRLTAFEWMTSDGLSMGCVKVLPDLARTVNANPGHERLVGLFMRALCQAGRKVEALDVYDRTRAYLTGELGLDPGRALRELHQSILRDDLQVARHGQRIVGHFPVPRQLPAGMVGFAGRTVELEQLDSIVPDGAQSQVPGALAVIAGMPGVGKTTLAVHWAQRVASRFPDGQLYMNMRGFDAGRRSASTVETLRGFLSALDVPVEQLPESLSAQIGLYRSLVAGKRLLILLDNVMSTEQVRPLLPGAPGCVVVVTSRNQLFGLVATEGAYPIMLDVPDAEDAREILERRLGAERIAVDDGAANEIVALSGRLPLALTIVAAQASTRPCLPLRALAEELQDPGRLLDACSDVGEDVDIRAVYSGSYQTLSPESARLFRLLSLHVGPDVSVPVAVSLTRATVANVRRALAELARGHLVVESSPGRFGLHILTHAYAAELLTSIEKEAEVSAARECMLEHYLHTAYAGAMLLHPHRRPIVLTGPRSGVQPEKLSADDALEWFRAEREVLLELVSLAADQKSGVAPWQLVWAMAGALERHGRWRELEEAWQRALDAAQQTDDVPGQAVCHGGLAGVYITRNYVEKARSHAVRAREIFDRVGDRVGSARSLLDIGVVMEQSGHTADALEYLQQGLLAYKREGDVAGHARALTMISRVHAVRGEYHLSLEWGRSALALLEQINDRVGYVRALDNLGSSLQHVEEYPLAAHQLERALEIVRELGDKYREVDVLVHLGDVYFEMGKAQLAGEAWNSALAVSYEIGRKDIDGIQFRAVGQAEAVRSRHSGRS